ncbi:hypothetical protein ABH932_005035 [Streptacidiphilus sp. MAP5-52]
MRSSVSIHTRGSKSKPFACATTPKYSLADKYALTAVFNQSSPAHTSPKRVAAQDRSGSTSPDGNVLGGAAEVGETGTKNSPGGISSVTRGGYSPLRLSWDSL